MKLTFLVLFLFVGQIYAQPPECTASTPNAQIVQGQADFISSTPGFSANQINSPGDIAFHPTTGDLYVLDTQNNRVMIFLVVALTTSTQSAIYSFGTFAISPISASTFSHPLGISISGLNDAWVADTGNNRVLRFSGVGTSTTAADQVLGQANFTSHNAPFPGTSNSMSNPTGIYADDFGNVWVSDRSNHRVMQFTAATISGGGLKPNGPNADYIYGDATLYSNSLPNTIGSPVGVFVDYNNIMWVADALLDRVVGYQNPLANSGITSTPIGANYVLGQSSLTAAALNLCSASNINGPTSVVVNPNTGALFIVDGGNNRIVGITNYNKTNGTAFDILIGFGTGSKSFTTPFAFTGTNVGSNTLNIGGTPGLADFDNKTSQALWIADSQNNRVLRYCIDVTGTPTISGTASNTKSTSRSSTKSLSPSGSIPASNSSSGSLSLSSGATASQTSSLSLGSLSVTGTSSISQSITANSTRPSGTIKCRGDCKDGKLGKICLSIGGTPQQTGNLFTCANANSNFVYKWLLAGNSCSQTGKLKFVKLCLALKGRLGCKAPTTGDASFTHRSCTYP